MGGGGPSPRRVQAASPGSRAADGRARRGRRAGLAHVSPAAELMLERAAEVASAPVKPVPSPCISICRMDAASGLCEGCFRNLDEIAAWGLLPDGEKRKVWQVIARRAAE